MPFLAKTRKVPNRFKNKRNILEVTLTIECLVLMRNQGGSNVFGKESSALSVLRIALLQTSDSAKPRAGKADKILKKSA